MFHGRHAPETEAHHAGAAAAGPHLDDLGVMGEARHFLCTAKYQPGAVEADIIYEPAVAQPAERRHVLELAAREDAGDARRRGAVKADEPERWLGGGWGQVTHCL